MLLLLPYNVIFCFVLFCFIFMVFTPMVVYVAFFHFRITRFNFASFLLSGWLMYLWIKKISGNHCFFGLFIRLENHFIPLLLGLAPLRCCIIPFMENVPLLSLGTFTIFYPKNSTNILNFVYLLYIPSSLLLSLKRETEMKKKNKLQNESYYFNFWKV